MTQNPGGRIFRCPVGRIPTCSGIAGEECMPIADAEAGMTDARRGWTLVVRGALPLSR
ncbi:MAG: hypothetical protein ACLTBB_10450 [Roseburia hominis]